MPVERVVQYALQTAEGLNEAHQQELFHGLLKPSNLMITPDNHVRILDFGIGCLLAETEGESLVDTMSTANSVNSGLDCASPESIMDPTNLTPIGDQYSLGCILYFCLAGRYPFPDGTAVEKMMCHQHKQPTPLADLAPDVPPALLEVVERLMAKDPAERYATTADVVDALRPFASEAAPRRHAPVRPVAPSTRLPASTPLPVPHKPAPTPTLNAPPTVRGSVKDVVHEKLNSLRPAKPAAPAPAPEPVEAPEPPVQHHASPQKSWDQKLGPVGIALVAIIAGAAAWVVSSFIGK